jgi:hypothetical protein
MPHAVGQRCRHLLGKSREQEAATAEPLAGLGGGHEKVATKHIR